MVFLPIVIFFFFFYWTKACHLDGYVPLPPSLRQIEQDQVFVNWVAAASEKVDIKGFELKYWKMEGSKKEGKTTVFVEDLFTNFAYVTVEKKVAYSYQIMVKTSG